MTINRAIAKIRRAGWTAAGDGGGVSNAYTATKPGNRYRITFSRNGSGESVEVINVAAHWDHSDMQSDYHAGNYVDSITKALAYADKWNIQDAAQEADNPGLAAARKNLSQR